jgi:CheY-like chemotaxis protein
MSLRDAVTAAVLPLRQCKIVEPHLTDCSGAHDTRALFGIPLCCSICGAKNRSPENGILQQPKIRLLVGDDSKVVHALFADIAARWPKPITVLNAYNGRQCVSHLEQGRVDVAFIDVAMPEMNGMEAIARMRYSGDRTFITLMSGMGSDIRFQLARHLKTYEFLVKPFEPQDVHRILSIHQRVSLPTRVVIVDDSATVRRMVKRILASSIFNIQVAEAANGEDALVMCASGGFDILFLDCNMPGLTGLETLDGLLSRNPEAKIIMMSGERNAELVETARERGAIEFLTKPFYPRDIDRVLHMAYNLEPPMLDDVPDGEFPKLPPLPA